MGGTLVCVPHRYFRFSTLFGKTEKGFRSNKINHAKIDFLKSTSGTSMYSGFQASVEFRFKPRQNSGTNPTWHPLRIKFPTEISKIPNNSFTIKSRMKSDNEFENNHYTLYASGTNPTWLKKKTPHLLEIQNTYGCV
jgi:hypothetical protein